jgi:hypothetical protein
MPERLRSRLVREILSALIIVAAIGVVLVLEIF